jgi:hypothetical protein
VAKIILAIDDTVLREITISQGRITIGRRVHNDVVIDDLAISGEHAAIITKLNESLLEDLNSTNGTQVNGQPVKKHFLQNNDMIELAQYSIRYVADARSRDADALPSMRHDAALIHVSRNNGHGERRRVTSAALAASRRAAAIKVLNGASAGKQISLTKALTTIGRPSVQVAVIVQRSQGYCLTHVEGDIYPLVNGQTIGAEAHSMRHGDVIDLAGTCMEFSLG